MSPRARAALKDIMSRRNEERKKANDENRPGNVIEYAMCIVECRDEHSPADSFKSVRFRSAVAMIRFYVIFHRIASSYVAL